MASPRWSIARSAAAGSRAGLIVCARREQEKVGPRDRGQWIAAGERHAGHVPPHRDDVVKERCGDLQDGLAERNLVRPRRIKETNVAWRKRRSLIAVMNAAGPVLLEHQEPSLFGLQIDQLACPVHPLRIGYDPQKVKLPQVLKMDAPAVDATIVRAPGS
jgi:hypothetical protein